MQIFMTGGSGFVGTGVVGELVAAGHAVRGLARSEKAAETLRKAGVTPVRGDLADVDRLRAEAAEADAVVHCGFIHDFANFAASVQTELRVVEAFLAGLREEKTLLVTSGIGLLAGSGGVVTEDTAVDPTVAQHPRSSVEAMVLAGKDKGLRVGLMRLPPSVHGPNDGGFVPILMDLARKEGVAAYVGNGENRWPAVHRDDAAALYRLAAEGLASGKLPSGTRFHAVADAALPFREIAEAIGDRLGLPVASRPADHFGWFGPFASMDAPASAAITERLTGWRPTRAGLLADIRSDVYARASSTMG
jgi:nucleoside-diphosphate-sugar epimerase